MRVKATRRVNQRGVMLLGLGALVVMVLLQTLEEGGSMPAKLASGTVAAGASALREVVNLEGAWRVAGRDSSRLPSSLSDLEVARGATNVTSFARSRLGPSESTLVLTYASFSYRTTLMNWMLSLERVGVRSFGVVCLDQELRTFLENRGIPCYLVDADEIRSTSKSATPAKGAGKRRRNSRTTGSGVAAGDDGATKLSVKQIGRLWILRLTHLVELLEAGINVVFSDSDAVWVKNALANGLLSERTGDIVMSRGKFPFDLTAKWGAAGCMGVGFFRAIPSVLNVVKKGLSEGLVNNDDQVGMNRALASVFGEDPTPVFGHKLELYSSRHDVVPGLSNQPRFVLLSHTSVPRFCNAVTEQEWAADVQIAHCHPRDGVVAKTHKNWGSSMARNAVLERYGLLCDLVDTAPEDQAAFSAWFAETAATCKFCTFVVSSNQGGASKGSGARDESFISLASAEAAPPNAEENVLAPESVANEEVD